MTDRINPPVFAAELVASGVSPEGWSVDNGTGVPVFGAGVSADVQAAVLRLIDAHDPAKRLPRIASAKQVRYALNDLGVRAAWNAAVGTSSQGAQDYWSSADPMVEDNTKIAKWCAASSITPQVLFDKAVAA